LFLQRLDVGVLLEQKAVTRAMTPVLSRPMTVMVANCFILEQEIANFRPIARIKVAYCSLEFYA
jgi:hypothetical protein